LSDLSAILDILVQTTGKLTRNGNSGRDVPDCTNFVNLQNTALKI